MTVLQGQPRSPASSSATTAEGAVEALCAALTRAGFSYPDEARVTFPIDGWIRAGFGGRHADIALGRTPFDESALSRRRRVKLFQTRIQIASPGDLILYKLTGARSMIERSPIQAAGVEE